MIADIRDSTILPLFCRYLNLRRGLGIIAMLALTFSSYGAPIELEMPNNIERSVTLLSDIKRMKELASGFLVELASGQGSTFVMLANDLTVQPGFSPALFSFPFAVGVGKFYVKGDTAHCIWRLNADGSRDESFDSPAVSQGDISLIRDLVIDSTGNLLVGCNIPAGNPSVYPGINSGLFRLETGGSNVGHTDISFLVDQPRSAEAVIILGGITFISYSSGAFASILPDGTQNPAFNPSALDGPMNAVDQRFGKFLVVGDFKHVNGMARPGLARLNGDGTLDESFDPPTGGGFAVATHLDARVLTAGPAGVQRFYPNGTPDPSFAISAFDASVVGLKVLALAQRQDLVYVAKGRTVCLYSGLLRLKIALPSTDVPRTFEHSTSIAAGWLWVPNTGPVFPDAPAFEFIDYEYPQLVESYYRLRP